MSPAIEIDEEVFDALKRHAEPFVDTPNDVLRRLLLQVHAKPKASGGSMPLHEAEVSSRQSDVRRRRGSSSSLPERRRRAPSNALLPEEEYELPLLRALAGAGGRLPTSEAIAAVGEALGDKLKPLDRESVRDGRARWEGRVQFVRLRLVEAGLMTSDAPRGVWEISDAGRARIDGMAVRP